MTCAKLKDEVDSEIRVSDKKVSATPDGSPNPENDVKASSKLPPDTTVRVFPRFPITTLIEAGILPDGKRQNTNSQMRGTTNNTLPD